jgi:DNA-binding MarR family transcriptional regulator
MTEPAPPPDALLVAVRRLGTALDRFDDAVARQLGVHRTDLRAMHLLEGGPVSAGEIAARLDLTTGSVTALIARLVDAELVTRTVDDADRRVVRIELRPDTWQKLAGVYGPAGRAVSEYSGSIGAARRNQSVTTLHAVADRLEHLLAQS